MKQGQPIIFSANQIKNRPHGHLFMLISLLAIIVAIAAGILYYHRQSNPLNHNITITKIRTAKDYKNFAAQYQYLDKAIQKESADNNVVNAKLTAKLQK
jgi:hypothetical protein